jgi:hypothetical protein
MLTLDQEYFYQIIAYWTDVFFPILVMFAFWSFLGVLLVSLFTLGKRRSRYEGDNE